MNYWIQIKEKLNDPIVLAIQLLLLILGAYTFIMADKHSFWKIPVLFTGVIVWFFWQNKRKEFKIWIILFLTTLLIDLSFDYFWVANHHFMLIFIVLSVLLYSYYKREDVLLKNVQIILVLVVLVSGLQKLMSEQFMNGNFYFYMMNRGSLFRKFIDFFPDIIEIASNNRESIEALKNTDPNIGQSIVLKSVFPKLNLMSQIFAWVTVIIEILVAIAILIKPKSFWTHLLFSAMIIGILCTRLETGFMALLAICGIFLCNNLKLRFLYTLIVIGCFLFIVTKLGYH